MINYQILFESHPLPLWIRDSETNQLLSMNKKAEKNYGNILKSFSEDEKIGSGVTIFELPLLENNKLAKVVMVNEECQKNLVLAKNLHKLHSQYWRNLQYNKKMYCQCLLDGTITWVNQSYCEYFKTSIRDLIGTKFPFILPKYEDFYFPTLTPDNPFFEYEYNDQTRHKWQKWTVEGIFDPDDNLLEYQFIGKDITLEKKQLKINQLKDRLNQVLEVAKIGTWDWNIVTGEIIWSNSLLELFGVNNTNYKVNFELLLQLIHPEDREKVLTAINNTINSKNEIPYNLEFRFLKPNGEVRYAMTQGTVIFDQNNRPIYMSGIDIDITEKVTILQELKKYKTFYETILDNLPIAVFVKDKDSKNLIWNKMSEQLFGINKKDALGKNAYEIFPEKQAEFFINQDKQTLAKKTLIDIHEEVIESKILGQRIITSKKFPLLDHNYNPQYLVCVSEDITEKKQMETALKLSETKFKSQYHAFPIPTYTWQKQGDDFILIDFNLAAFNITRGHVAKLVGQTLNNFYQDRPDIIEDFKLCFNSEQTVKKKITYQMVSTGEDKILLVNYAFVFPDLIMVHTEDITEQENAIEALQKSEENYRRLIETTNEGVFVLNISNKIVFLNNKFAEMLGYSQRELLGKHWSFFLNSDEKTIKKDGECSLNCCPWNQEKLECSLNLCPWTKEQQEVTMRCKNGDLIYTVIATNILYRKDGQILGNLAMVTNITELKLSQIALERLNSDLENRVNERTTQLRTINNYLLIETDKKNKLAEQYQNVINNIKEIVFQLDNKFNVVFLNQQWSWITGFQYQESLEKKLLNFVSLKYFEKTKQNLIKLLNKETNNCHFESQLIAKNGEIIWVEIRAVLEEKTNHIIGTINDITERYYSQIELKNTQQYLQHLLASSSALIYTCDPYTLSCNFVSQNSENILGYKEDEIHFWSDYIHEDDLITLFNNLSEHKLNKTVHEYRFLHKNNNYIWLRDELKIIRDQYHKPKEIIGCIININDRKLAEQELIKNFEKEKELSELKSRFIAMTSHEFRTPLTTILSSTELLQRYEWETEDKNQILEQIENAVKHLAALLDDVRNINEQEKGSLTFNPEPLFIVDFCQRFIKEMQNNIAKEHTIIFQVNTQKKELKINLDDKLIRQMLTNLFSNAIKYSPKGSKIIFNLTLNSDNIYFQIKDHGIGIPPECLNNIFTIFYRGNNVGNISGTGLGLVIVKNCVELHHGKIEVDSKSGEGTTFTVTIPLENS